MQQLSQWLMQIVVCLFKNEAAFRIVRAIIFQPQAWENFILCCKMSMGGPSFWRTMVDFFLSKCQDLSFRMGIFSGMVGILAVEMMVVPCLSTQIQELAWPWTFEMTILWWWSSIWTGLLHQLHSNWRDWQDIELALYIFFQHGKTCSMLCSFLPGVDLEQATWF